MSELTVRAYNVLFGDALLISIPEEKPSGKEVVRHILIDVGNLVLLPDDVFAGVVADIHKQTGGTVDLYVMTHEHMDHVKGLYAAHRVGVDIKVRHAWLTGSAAPDYLDRYPNARKQKKRFAEALEAVTRLAAAATDPWVKMMIENNSLLLGEKAHRYVTDDCVRFLRTIAAEADTHYVDRETSLDGLHPFTETTLRLLAPEADTSDYYGRPPARLTATPAEPDPAGPDPADPDPAENGPRSKRPLEPPVGIDAGAFFDLVESRNRGIRHTLLEIDKAANNTSIVLEIEWRGWRLLFGGDAEERSWRTILRRGPIAPVHVLKVSHHGSVNGTILELLDSALPTRPPDRRPRYALVSTHDDNWASVPDTATLTSYSDRVTLVDTRTVAVGEAVVITLPG